MEGVVPSSPCFTTDQSSFYFVTMTPFCAASEFGTELAGVGVQAGKLTPCWTLTEAEVPSPPRDSSTVADHG